MKLNGGNQPLVLTSIIGGRNSLVVLLSKLIILGQGNRRFLFREKLPSPLVYFLTLRTLLIEEKSCMGNILAWRQSRKTHAEYLFYMVLVIFPVMWYTMPMERGYQDEIILKSVFNLYFSLLDDIIYKSKEKEIKSIFISNHWQIVVEGAM